MRPGESGTEALVIDRFRSAPSRAELRTLLVHEIVREWPETLEVLERAGVSVSELGGRSLSSSSAPTEPVVEALIEATSWRARPPDPA